MYGKHFASTYTGSMVGAGLNVFAVWGYVIANTRKSRIELNPKLLAMLLGCKEQEVTAAIKYLATPDSESRTKAHEGRRLVQEGQYQYFVPTFETYRSILNEDERREYNRIKQAEHRAKASVKEDVIDMSALSAQSEAEAEAEPEANTKNDTYVPVPVEIQQQAFTAYGHLPEVLAGWLAYYPPAWIPLAITATVNAAKKSPAYTKAILERWRAQGGPDAAKKPTKEWA